MARHPRVAPYVAAVRQSNGQQEIEFKNGSRILFGAREQGFGRGFAKVDILVFDEAQILSEAAMEDMVPATNAAPNGLAIFMGTPPRPKDPGQVFKNLRAQALAGDPDTLYVECSADEDCAPESWGKNVDWAQIAKANPSFPHRTGKRAILRMRKLLANPDSFRREALGIWDADDRGSFPLAEYWPACEVDDRPMSNSPVSFAVKFSVDGSHVALSAAQRVDEERVLVDPVGVQACSVGVDWLVDFLSAPERLSRTAQIVVEGKGGVGYLVERLRASRVPGRVLITPTTEQAIAAHSMFLASARARRVVHLGDEVLSQQVGWATTRKIGNAGGFGWSAPDDHSVALLDAATMAHWAAVTSKRRPGRKGGGATVL